MVYDILKDIRCVKYRRLLDFLNERCDTFTFMFPKYHCLAVTEDNYEIMSDESHKIGDKFYIEESDALREEKMFSEYIENNRQLLQRLSSSYIRTFETTCYGGQITGYVCLANVYMLNSDSLEVLKSQKSLFSWQRVYASKCSLPCDLCFYEKGVPVLETVSHESEGWLYINDDELRKLNNIRIKVERSINQYVPKADPQLML